MIFSKYLLALFEKNKELRFLFIGGCNTIFGYFSGLLIYFMIGSLVNIIFVLIFSYVVAVTESFLAYKLFVFKTNGNWFSEYIKCYYLSSFNAVIGMVGIYFLYEKLSIPFWIAQGVMLFITLIFSYLGLKKYIFNRL